MINAAMLTDGYKTSHAAMYPKGTQLVVTNGTARSGKHANIPNSKGIYLAGTQLAVQKVHEIFEHFFSLKEGAAMLYIAREYSMYLGAEYSINRFSELYQNRQLPIEIKSLPEGYFVPYRVPFMTIHNTKPEFYWLVNFLETIISSYMWPIITTTTTAKYYWDLFNRFGLKTDPESYQAVVPFQGHDFSARGLMGPGAWELVGIGHAFVFSGSDTLASIPTARHYYDAKDFVVASVPASEHAVMCAGEKESELDTFQRLMSVYPTGILSVVSDTWDLWKVLTEYLPQLKEEILAREGKLVIRPDSGDPVDIICGSEDYKLSKDLPERKGVIELLWDVFGGTVNDQGYKILNSKVGAIYGDSITPEIAKEIMMRLEVKGFATTNVVLGIGSYTYQYVTRDTHGIAFKATYAEVNGESRNLFKAPVTDSGVKKSAVGLPYVKGSVDEYELVEEVTFEEFESPGNNLKTMYKNGVFTHRVTLNTVRARLRNF